MSLESLEHSDPEAGSHMVDLPSGASRDRRRRTVIDGADTGVLRESVPHALPPALRGPAQDLQSN